MLREFWLSRRWAWWAYGLGSALLGVELLSLQVELAFNRWLERLYSELQRSTEPGALDERLTRFADVMAEFGWLSVPWSLLGPLINYTLRTWALKWREALTSDYLHRWRMQAASAGSTALELEGVSQRVQEDVHKFANGVDSIGHDLFVACLELAAFVPVLHSLTGWLPVAVCVGGNAAGLLLSTAVGAQLVTLDYNNQKTEAAFRKELVYAEDGHGARFRSVWPLFDAVVANYRTLFRHLTYFEVWIRCFDRLMDAAPKLVTAPMLFRGQITFGRYMQVKSAFEKVQGRLSMVAHRWTEINELRSVARRLRELEVELRRGDAGGDDTEDVGESRMLLQQKPPDQMV